MLVSNLIKKTFKLDNMINIVPIYWGWKLSKTNIYLWIVCGNCKILTVEKHAILIILKYLFSTVKILMNK